MVEKRTFQKTLVITTFEEKHPNVDKELIEDILYKASNILYNRKCGLFKNKIYIGTDDIGYIMSQWDNNEK